MASSSSRRTTKLPPGWAKIRAEVLRRDGHQCTVVEYTGARCTMQATEVDHIGHADDHDPDNLRAICKPHHASKTGGDANRVRWTRVRRQHEPPPHPGLV